MLEQVDMDDLLEEHAEGLDDDDGSVLNTALSSSAQVTFGSNGLTTHTG